MQMTRNAAGPQWKTVLLSGLLILILAAAVGRASAANGTIEKRTDGTYFITGADYRAQISRGMLDSLKIKGAEFFNGPLLAGNAVWQQLKPVDWRVVKTETPQPDTLHLTLALAAAPQDAVLSMTYRAAPDGLRVTMQRLSDKWGGTVGWHTGEQVIALEPLARPGFGYSRLPGNGLVYALPLAAPREVRDMRYYLDNRSALDVTYLLNDGPYNIGVSGLAIGDGWGRSLLDLRPLETDFCAGPFLWRGSVHAELRAAAAPSARPVENRRNYHAVCRST